MATGKGLLPLAFLPLGGAEGDKAAPTVLTAVAGAVAVAVPVEAARLWQVRVLRGRDETADEGVTTILP